LYCCKHIYEIRSIKMSVMHLYAMSMHG